ncbi:MAG TPA: hypothetical protein VNV65_05730 [Candidatus Solibacter sp.]|nr:hypothetical protein [Candidatus Solibacter sp.]
MRKRVGLVLTSLALLVALGLPASVSADLQVGVQLATAWTPPVNDNWQGHGIDPLNPAACDPLDPAQCMLPYPNDWFTRPDTSSLTGRRLDLTLLGMPHNAVGKPIEPFEWNRSDGFSAGAQILTLVPGMTKNEDLTPSSLPDVTYLGLNSKNDLGVILLDTQTGKRWPVWTEIDQYTQEAGLVATGTVQNDLMIHPAVNLTDGHRYIVALRHLVKDDGTQAQPSAAFQSYRDGTAPLTDPRRQHMENIFSTLQQARVRRSDLYLAWDFTTASTKNVTGRLLSIRDDAFAQLGDTNLADGVVSGSSPAFTVDAVNNYSASQNTNIARQVTGHFTVPCYIAPTCDPPAKCSSIKGYPFDDCPMPGQFLLDPLNPDALPQRRLGQTYQANFICNIGRGGFEAHQKLRPVEYGHGLFGGAGEVNSDAETSMAQRFGMMYCATDWTGMASADVPNAILALSDLSRFPFLTDRVQQGELNFLYLARVMIHTQGFGSNPAFQYGDGSSIIDTRQPFYDGNSQGGIFGGTVCAVSVDVRRCTLGVVGMDYSILLPRSSDYVATKPLSQTDIAQLPNDPTGQIGYSDIFDLSYPDQSQRMLILDLIQTLWDRSDPNGYASHMTGERPQSRLPNTPTHHVLLQPAYGDHQVANITAETEARTIGAAGLYPPLVTARFAPYVDPFWNIPVIQAFPYDGSAITLFDTGPVRTVPPGAHNGTDPPPTSDVPNRSGDDPHEAPRRAPWGQVQKNNFLQVGGVVTNPQPGGSPYFAWGWDGISGL